ncbi:MAG: acyl-CoA thioesterase [Planctomycetes bacterium]|nr:acyl-CoA thioesterase [Planctomycetota bacterium]
MAFVFNQKVLFRHCDPAGIVFYPRYFEMMNDCVEAFFDEALAWPFSSLHRDYGVPTAQISTRFVAPSRLGDILKITLGVTKPGRSSLGLSMRAACDGDARFETHSTLVLVNRAGRPEAWPDSLKEQLNKYLEDDRDGT